MKILLFLLLKNYLFISFITHMVSSYRLLQGLPLLWRAILPKVLSFLGPMTERHRGLKARLFQANEGHNLAALAKV